MSSWGNILGTMVGGNAGNLINFGSSILDKLQTDKEAKTVKNSYYAALAQQQEMGKMATATAAQRAAFEKAMKDRILTQTGDLGTTMRSAQRGMGAMPQFDQAKINTDYTNTKATMMNDFNDMLKLVESQGRSNQMERLGGADSYAASNDRMNALIKRYNPELQKIDDAAYGSAVSRATNTQNLISKSRADTLGEIKGIYDSEIDPELKLLKAGGTDISNLMNSNSSAVNSASSAMSSAEQNQGATDTILSGNLGTLLARTFNR